MRSTQIQAPAKLNLTLDVLGKRPDGYHDLRMVMMSITLADTITLQAGETPGIWVRSNMSFLPTGEKNLAAAAALRYWQARNQTPEDLFITIRKRIPVCAGMGGGSSDAAAVLRALNEMDGSPFTPKELAKIGDLVGADVPYCVMGGTMLAEGKGEVLTPLPSLPRCWVVVCKPDFPISTPELFARIDGVKLRCHPDTSGMLAALEAQDLAGVARRMYNVFEDVLPERQGAKIMDIKSMLIQCGALGACMTGSGSAVFGLFEQRDRAEAAYAILSEGYRDTFFTETV